MIFPVGPNVRGQIMSVSGLEVGIKYGAVDGIRRVVVSIWGPVHCWWDGGLDISELLGKCVANNRSCGS